MRKAYLIIAIALLVVAAGGSSANAAQIEVTDESDHCSQMENTHHVVESGCEIHATADENLVLRVHVAGTGEVVFEICTNEFDARVQEDGSGFAYAQTIGGASCDLTPCAEAGGGAQLAWPFTAMEVAGTESLFLTFCVVRLGTSVACSVATSIVTDGVHDYEIRAAGQRCSQSSTVSVQAHWNIEGTPIAIAH